MERLTFRPLHSSGTLPARAEAASGSWRPPPAHPHGPPPAPAMYEWSRRRGGRGPNAGPVARRGSRSLEPGDVDSRRPSACVEPLSEQEQTNACLPRSTIAHATPRSPDTHLASTRQRGAGRPTVPLASQAVHDGALNLLAFASRSKVQPRDSGRGRRLVSARPAAPTLPVVGRQGSGHNPLHPGAFRVEAQPPAPRAEPCQRSPFAFRRSSGAARERLARPRPMRAVDRSCTRR